MRKPLAGGARAAGGGNGGGGAAVDELTAQVADLRVKAEGAEKEKDFYYQKLRDIELLCQTPVVADIPIVQRIEGILYAASAEDGRRLLEEAQIEFAGQVG